MLRVGLWAPEAGRLCGHVLSGFGVFHVVRADNLAALFQSLHRRKSLLRG